MINQHFSKFPSYIRRKMPLLFNKMEYYLRSELRYKYYSIKYDKPASPWKILNINPSDVMKAIQTDKRHKFNQNKGLGIISDGDWDKAVEPIEDFWIYSGLYERYEQGKNWHDTIYVQRVPDWLDRKGSAFGNETVDEFVNNRCSYVDRLFRDIKNNGYERSRHSRNVDTTRHQTFYPYINEIVLSIGRDGELILHDGFHRFTIAEILDLSAIPVHILLRHEEWQNKRDELYSDHRKSSEMDIHHPDLNDVVCENNTANTTFSNKRSRGKGKS